MYTTDVTYKGKPAVRYTEAYIDPRTGRRRHVSITLPDRKLTTQRQASDALARRIELLTTDQDAPARLTVARLVELYLDHQAHTVRPQTVRSNGLRLRAVVSALGPDTLVTALSAPYITRTLMKADDNPTTYNGRLTRLCAVLRWAYRSRYLDRLDYLDGLTRLRDRAPAEARRRRYLEPAELSSLLSGMDSAKWRLVTATLALTGLRVGELIALQRRDVDRRASVIRITKTYSLTLHTVSPMPKTDAGFRDISIQTELARVLDAVESLMAYYDRKAGSRSPYYLHEMDGSPLHYESYSKYLRENAERILGRRVQVHALRHTHTALMAAAGVPLDVLSRRLGHKTPAVTAGVYMHITERLKAADFTAVKDAVLLPDKARKEGD